MKNLFKNKKILITGGAGSIGIEILREILKYEPAVVRILDVDETKQFEIQQEYTDYKNIRFLLGDIRDKDRLLHALRDIDIVFHTAAYKHVLSSEYNPFEAIKTNVIGVQNVIEAAIDTAVEKVIFTSSDKAVNPCNVMGATKLLGERLITAANYYRGTASDTIFSSVRFGNVLGSRGSVSPLFKRQIQKGGPVTITNKEMTRFVMSNSQTINLLFKVVEIAQGGEIFIFKMPVIRITDLAEVMIDELAPKYGYNADDIAIKIIGNKPGEKVYEELMTVDESARSLETEELFIVLPALKEELGAINSSVYPKALQAELRSYRSDDTETLSKKEIKDLLYKENLLLLDKYAF
jgi:FlaA1/EpsC-like NDP-sugar epimerase